MDELDIETIAAAHAYDDVGGCGDEQQIDEYRDYSTAAAHHHNSGCGCLLPIIAAFSFTFGTMILILVF
jgi:hypothetical protein